MQEEVFSYLIGGCDRNFTYFIACQKEKELAIIDPADYFPKIEEKLSSYFESGFRLSKILLTHAHPDHVISLASLREKYPETKVLAHPLEKERIRQLSQVEIDSSLKNLETIKLGQEKLKVVYTPGHQESSICFIWREKIFTGDTLFVDGCGRCDLPGGNLEKQLNSLRYLANQVPEELLVCSGHDYGRKKFSTLKEQKRTNLYLLNLEDHLFEEKIRQNWLTKRRK